jgi:hypothetical protein
MIDTRGAGPSRPSRERRPFLGSEAGSAPAVTRTDRRAAGVRDRAAGWDVTPGSPSIEELEAEARYARERYQLYRAKTYGPRPTSMARLRELERIYEGAEARLRRARERGAATADE